MADKMNGATIAVIVIVSVLVLALVSVLIVQAVNYSGDKTIYVKKGANNGNTSMGSRMRVPPPRSRMQLATAPTPFMAPPTYDAPAPMPQTQLMQPPAMPNSSLGLPGVPTSLSTIGDATPDIMTTEQSGTSVSPFQMQNYTQDPAMMTPSSATDIKGLQTFMPFMGGGVGGEQENGDMGGAVDPNTGLPLFTAGKLIRSQLLGGHGAGSFLRQVQDPLTGYKKTVGKNLCGVQQARRDLEVRRKQLNAARLANEDLDPVLFYMSDFSYN
jgi:hypothetical protein